MGEKDVKSAKKLYAKMKKAQKAQNRQETPVDETLNAGSEAPVESSDAPAAPSEDAEAVASDSIDGTSDLKNSKEKEEARDSGNEPPIAEDRDTEGPAAEADVITDSIEKSVAEESAGDQIAVTEPAREEAAVPTAVKESTEGLQEAETEITATASLDDSSVSKDDGAVKKAEEDVAIETSSSALDGAASRKALEAENKEPATSHTANSTQQATAASKTEESTDFEVVAALKEENDSLKKQIKKLQNRVLSLETELAALRDHNHTEVSLSPPTVAQDKPSIDSHRNRTSSFVEADLYSESAKINSRSEQMKKWKGYQLDLRAWRRPLGIGEMLMI